MSRLVPVLLLLGAALGIAGIVLTFSGQTVIGLALLAVGIGDAAAATVLRSRSRS